MPRLHEITTPVVLLNTWNSSSLLTDACWEVGVVVGYKRPGGRHLHTLGRLVVKLSGST